MGRCPTGSSRGCLARGGQKRGFKTAFEVEIVTEIEALLGTGVVELGEACHEYQNDELRNLNCRRLQLDEVWSFTYAKQKNVARAKAAPEGAGDTWTWTALDADSKLIVSWLVGGRDAGYATEFMQDLAGRLANRVQLTSDATVRTSRRSRMRSARTSTTPC